MKKIGIKVSQYIGVDAHGAESHLIGSFCNILDKEFKLDLIGSEIYPDELKTWKMFTYLKYYFFPSFIRPFFHILISVINTFIYTWREKPDLLFSAGGVFYNGLAVFIAGRFFGVKTIVRTAEDHHNYYKYCNTVTSRLKHYFFNKKISTFVLQRSDYVLTVGERSRQYFIESCGLNVDRVFAIPGPIIRDRFSEKKDKVTLRKKLGLPVDKKIVLYVGAVAGVKGTDELPNIIAAVLRKSDDVYFVIVGRESKGTKITRTILEAGGKRVRFFPPVPHDGLAEYFQMADVLIFLTKVGVGYGQVTIEATLSGLPVVAYNPGLDVQWFLGDACCDSTCEIAERILNGSYKQVQIPPEFTGDYIRDRHIELFRKVTA